MINSQKKKKQRSDKVVEEIAPLAAIITKLQAQMKAAGLFPNDRELLDCPRWRLEEDVTIEGLLITSRSEWLAWIPAGDFNRLTTARIGGAVLPAAQSFAAKLFRNDFRITTGARRIVN